MGKSTQAQASKADVGERILAMLEDFGARLTALETPAQNVPATPTDEAKPAPARKATKAEKAAAKAKREAKVANAARLERNTARGTRMPNARFVCESCHGCYYVEAKGQAHAAKTGHVVVDA